MSKEKSEAGRDLRPLVKELSQSVDRESTKNESKIIIHAGKIE